MNDLSKFAKFAKKQDLKKEVRKEVWAYTRVSSIDQKSNYSLNNQEKAAMAFSEDNGYQLIKSFGGTYESGKDDFTRAEFSRLLTEVKNAKRKPYAIIVYKMNRFSRSGGKSIALAHELVHIQGVNLIEIISGLDTTTPKGFNELNKRLLAAEEENISKLEHTLLGMKSLLQEGYKLGSTPVGFDHYGPKVKDPNKHHYQQKIVVNDTGKKLRLAWQWKVEGETDANIRKRLLELGVKVSKQRLSDMWRNPFYCGIISHKMLDGEIVMGKHEALISQDTFLKVQDIISQNNQGYKVERKDENRPLTGTILCLECGSKLTGYFNKQRARHYYKCNSCKGVSINADTPSAKRYMGNYGAHNLLIELLDSFQLDDKYLNAFTRQMKTMLSNTDKANKSEDAVYKKQLTELINRKESLAERFAFGDIEMEMYTKFLCQTEEKIANLKAKYAIPEIDLSNIKSNLNEAIYFTQNVSKHWASGNLNHKQRIQKLVFPEGIRIDTDKRQYLTSKVNGLFSEKRVFIRDTEGDKKEKPTENGGLSCLVAGVGETSNFELLKDLAEVIDFMNS